MILYMKGDKEMAQVLSELKKVQDTVDMTYNNNYFYILIPYNIHHTDNSSIKDLQGFSFISLECV